MTDDFNERCKRCEEIRKRIREWQENHPVEMKRYKKKEITKDENSKR